MSKEIPDRIWLQVHGDAPPDQWDEPVDIWAGDVTWCWECIFDGDVEYVRADTADAKIEAKVLEDLLDYIDGDDDALDVIRRIERRLNQLEKETQ